jgi:hypothetical protein
MVVKPIKRFNSFSDMECNNESDYDDDIVIATKRKKLRGRFFMSLFSFLTLIENSL